jgi:hypothetical protein
MTHPRKGLGASSLIAALVTTVIAVSIVAYVLVLNPSPDHTTTSDPAGLQLRLSISGDVIAQGDNVSIEISEFNTLPVWNDAPTTTFQTLSASPCRGFLPLGVGIFQGDYSSGNISSAQPLDMFYPGTYNCPGLIPGGASYVFAPDSDNTTGVSPQPTTVTNTVTSNDKTSVEYTVTTLGSARQVAASLSFSGYWTGSEVPLPSNATFHAFDPGAYTVEGVDWWGHVMFAYFQVVSKP